MAIWVQLRSAKYIEIRGKMQRFEPGDWVKTGKQQALRWIAAGDATSPKDSGLLPSGIGIAARGSLAKQGSVWRMGVQVVPDPGFLPFPRTLIWETSLKLRTGLLMVGFKLLDKWQVAAPLWDYNKLACHEGEEEDRAATAKIVRDLRVPLYDPRMVFLRRCKDTQRLLDLWNEERKDGSERLAFLRVLYTVKPTICALPTSWANKKRAG